MTTKRTIGEYFQPIKVIGQGGMGTIYQGVDRRTQNQVVIKTIRTEFLQCDPHLIERFRQEAEMIRQLNHPNILNITAIIDDAHEYFIVMDYLDGGSLREMLRQKKYLPVTQALAITQQLADALSAIHQIGVCHRDLKPENVLFGHDGKPKLTDFSMALTNPDEHSTFTGMAVGTLAYLSPEAVNLAVIDERDDIWALGMMLYEMIGGSRPFSEETSYQLLDAILHQAPDSLLNRRAETHWAVWELTKWMLEKEPEDRIRRADLIKQAVVYILKGDFTPPPTDSAQYTAHFRQRIQAGA